jgi:predicted TIM-barrel fold metal-dependent hydrolase
MKEFRLAWLRRLPKTRPEPPLPLPINLGSRSNGEVFHPASANERAARALTLAEAEVQARRLGLDRREFLASNLGVAASLAAINLVEGCGSGQNAPGAMNGGASGNGGPADAGGPNGDADTGLGSDVRGYYEVGPDIRDPGATCERMLDPSKEFIFDIQTHHVVQTNALYQNFLAMQPYYLPANSSCKMRGLSATQCFSRNEYTRLMFLESDTSVAVLSGLPAAEAENPITNRQIAESREIINMLADGTQRLVNHAMVLPNQTPNLAAHLAAMEQAQQMWKVGAWKCYPAWDPRNTQFVAPYGMFLDETLGLAMIEKGLQLGVGTFCIHKGLPIPGFSTRYNDPRDIGVVAKMFPQAKFIVYHSGFGNGNNYSEGPYVDGSLTGVNSLITALVRNNVAPNSNVYAELGTTWQIIKSSPNQAAHVIGKLLRYVGENNIVWGTDSIWYGSPQEQIQSFLQFNISGGGYPALTMDIKRKILGLNAARAYGIDPAAMRCAIAKSSLARIKRDLDDEFGRTRWAFNRPSIRTRRGFLERLRLVDGPG